MITSLWVDSPIQNLKIKYFVSSVTILENIIIEEGLLQMHETRFQETPSYYTPSHTSLLFAEWGLTSVFSIYL